MPAWCLAYAKSFAPCESVHNSKLEFYVSEARTFWGKKRTADMHTEAEGMIGNLYNFLNIKGLKSGVLKSNFLLYFLAVSNSQLSAFLPRFKFLVILCHVQL